MQTAEEIERIVREVIRRLTSGQVHAAPPAHRLQVNDRVITLSLIEGKLNGIRELVVPAKAIVTPSVCDELRSSDIQLVRQEVNASLSRTNQKEILVANLGTVSISQAMMSLPCEVKTVSSDSLEAALKTMTGQLTDNTTGVIITDRPEVAVCLASRSANVNAFVGYNAGAIQRAKATINANLLVLDSATNNFTTTSLIKMFIRL